MSAAIDYYFTPQSPWTYLGHARFAAMARAAGATVNLLPADFGQVFAVSGGLPLGKRAPQRQAYRLLELGRFGEHLKMPINVQPRFFPVGGDPAARVIIAVQQHDGVDAAMTVSGAIFKAVWEQERDIASDAVLAELLAECGLDVARLEQSRAPAVQAQYDANTKAAIDNAVFGAPTFVVDGEMFWGQDRLDFVERKLRA
ncbi:MAG: 2-hydroxychromene-2-carboxylate isomerase [Comamonadaceae bacterium]|nr:MAG: 2-hydroxychromene-2-carboxylate isomerase [Comamonadaceae bacterium]